jgi:tRNA pseudouridine38-40 synthase
MRLKLVVEYAGTRYSGWQIQKNARTVQGEIEAAIRKATGSSDFELYGSGRTDAGVHALGQVAHLELRAPPRISNPKSPIQRRAAANDTGAAALVAAINDNLPADINILSATKVPHRFHARHDAVARSYLYQVALRRTAFAKPYVWWVKGDIDVGRMAEAARLFVGMQDFRSFTDSDPREASTIVQVERLQIDEAGALLLLRIEGSHFLWKMVRRVVGVMIEVGKGAMAPGEVQSLFDRHSPLPARLTAPASGLFLERVFYPGDRRDYPLVPALTLIGLDATAR